jgi:hypothetical protein
MNPSGQVHGDALTPHVVFRPHCVVVTGKKYKEFQLGDVNKDVLEMASTEEEVVKAVLSNKSKLEEKLGC